jgi:arginine decarboxylase
MNIKIVSGKSEGKTLVSAFDLALANAGINNYNLQYLSSIIPKGAEVIEVDKYNNQERKIGDIVNLVIAQKSSDEPQKWISCGIAWVQAKEGGILIEESCEGRADEVERLLREGAEDMMSIRDWSWNTEIMMKTIEHKVENKACVVVVAVYDW